MAEGNCASKLEKMEMLEMLEIMEYALKIPTKGVKSVIEAKKRLQERIEESRRMPGWTVGEAFTVFSDAKTLDASKRKKLKIFYKEVEHVLQSCDKNMLQSLNEKYMVENIVDDIEGKIKKLEVEEYVVLIAGETKSGKTSFINLILGEDILPSGSLPLTATICELRYGEIRKLKAYYNEDEKTEELILRDPAEGQSYPDQLTVYLDRSVDRKKGSRFKKCELFWPHDLLKNGIVIVDSPGIGESSVFDTVVEEYLRDALCFVYVIDSTHAEGVQNERISLLFKRGEKNYLEYYSSEHSLFVCNKWDLIERKGSNEETAVIKYVINHLEKKWPNLNPKTQVVHMSTTNAALARDFGIKSEQFVTVMDAIKTMLLKTIAARLETKWRWLDDIVRRLIFQAKLVVKVARDDDLKTQLRSAYERLGMIAQEHVANFESLKEAFQGKTKEAVDKLSQYLSSDVFKNSFQSWDEDQCPQRKRKEPWEETEKKIDEAIKQRFVEEIARWENEHHVIEDSRKLLLNQLKRLKNRFRVGIQSVEDYVIQEPSQSSTVNHPNDDIPMSKWQNILMGKLARIWVPVSFVVGILRVPVSRVIAMKSAVQAKDCKLAYKKNKPSYMAKKTDEFCLYCIDQESEAFVLKQFSEISNTIEKMELEMLALIKADSSIICHFIKKHTLQLRDADMYASLQEACSATLSEMSIFAINDVVPSDVDLKDLEYNENSPLGEGSFGAVFKGKIITEDKGSLNVAVKVSRKVISTENASMLLAEEQILRKLHHKNIVKFYGRALQPEQNGLKIIFVMELCSENLREFFRNHPECIPAKAQEDSGEMIPSLLRKAKDIAMGLDYLHHQFLNGIIHRDLKPENILVGEDNCMKIADVGISKNVHEVTATKTGTPLYMAPEVFVEEFHDLSTDIYSFGLILWEMWYGEVVFKELGDISEEELGEKIASGYRPKFEETVGFASIPKYVSLVESCWQRQQQLRPTADQCVAKLDDMLSGNMA